MNTYCVVTRGQFYIFVYFVDAEDGLAAQRAARAQMEPSERIEATEQITGMAHLPDPLAIPLPED